MRLSILIAASMVFAACTPFDPGTHAYSASTATGSNIPKKDTDAVSVDKERLSDALKQRTLGTREPPR